VVGWAGLRPLGLGAVRVNVCVCVRVATHMHTQRSAVPWDHDSEMKTAFDSPCPPPLPPLIAVAITSPAF
jgi:hypothetical protein